MTDIALRLGPSPLQIGPRDADNAPSPAAAPSSPAIDTKAHSGLGALSERLIAAGDGQTAQRLPDSGQTQALLTDASPAVRTLLADGATGPGANGIQDLKERQLGNGDGRGTSLLQKAGSALRSLLSELSNMVKAVLHAPLALIRAAMGNGAEAGVKTTFLASKDAAAFEASVTHLNDVLATDPLIDKNPVNGFFGNEVLPRSTLGPAGAHKQAIKDWAREGVTVEGKSYTPDFAGVSQAAEKLVELCGGNEASANWISRFANQQGLGAISINTGLLELGPNGESGYMLLGGRPEFEIKSLEGGGVEVVFRQKWTPDESNLTQNYEPVDVNVFDKDIELSYALAFTMPDADHPDECPKVSVSQPFQARS